MFIWMARLVMYYDISLCGENSNFLSLQCIVRSKKLISSCSSFFIVNFMNGCKLLNSLSGCSMFV
jgi:hypothetical protein